MIYLNTLDLCGCPVNISRLSNNASLYSSTAFPFAPFISQQSVFSYHKIFLHQHSRQR